MLNLLICGCTGSGKSNFLRYCIVGLLNDKVAIYGIDLKGGIEFKVFRDLFKGFARTEDDALVILDKLYDLMLRRVETLWQSDCLNYEEYNNLNNRFSFYPVCLVIEEFSLLSANSKFINKFILFLNQCRCVNMSAIITCQRPEHKVLDVRIRTNIENVVVFKLTNKNDYNLIELPQDCTFKRKYVGYVLPGARKIKVPVINSNFIQKYLNL